MKRSGFLSRKGRGSGQQGDDKSARPSRANAGWQAARRPSNDPQAAQTTRNSPAISHKKGGKLQLGRASRTHLVEQDPLKPYREKIQQSQHNLRERLLRLCHTPARHPEIMAKLRQYHAQLSESERRYEQSLSVLGDLEDEGLPSSVYDIHDANEEILSTLNKVLHHSLPLCDLFTQKQLTEILSSDTLTNESDCFAPLNGVIHLIKLRDILRSEARRTLSKQFAHINKALDALADYYSEALLALCKATPAERRAILQPKAYISLGGMIFDDRDDQPLYFEFDVQDTIEVPGTDESMPLLTYLLSLSPTTVSVNQEDDPHISSASYQGLQFSAIQLGDRSNMAESASSFAASYSPELAFSSGWIKLFHVPLWSLDDYTGEQYQALYRNQVGVSIVNTGYHYYIEQFVQVSEVKDNKPLDAITISPKIFTDEKPIFRFLAWIVEQFQHEQYTQLSIHSGNLAANDASQSDALWEQLRQRFYPEVLPQLFAGAKYLAEEFQASEQGLSNKESVERLRELSAILFLYRRLVVKGEKLAIGKSKFSVLSHVPLTISDCLPIMSDKKLRYELIKHEKRQCILDLPHAIQSFFNGYIPTDKKGPRVNDTLTEAFSFNGYTLEEKLQILQVIGTQFPFIHELKSLTDSKDSLLLQAAKHALPGAVKLLLRLGAKVEANDANGRDVLHQLLLRPINDEKHLARILATLDVLMSCANFNPFAVDHQGYMAIMHLISHAKIFQMKFIERIIRKLQMLPVFDINHPTERGTLLDLVMSFKNPPKPALFVLLVRLGAGRYMNVKNALAYTTQYAKTPGMEEAERQLCRPGFNSEYYYARAIDMMSVDPNEYKGQTVALESMDGTYIYLHPDVASQVFDEEGRVRPIVAEGRRRVAPIEFEGFRLHVKENPEAHANQDIAGLVRRRFGSYDITPYGDVYLLRDKSGIIFPIQMTVTTPGESYKRFATNNERNNLNSRAATEVLLTDAILVPEDFNANNATFEEAVGRLFIFDEDHCLIGERGSEKSIMYCQREMLDEPLDPTAIAQFCMRDLRAEMRYFGAWIAQRDKRCRAVLTDKMVTKIGKVRFQDAKKSVTGLAKTALGMEAKPLLGYFCDNEMLVNMYLRMKFIQDLLRSNPNMTWRTYITMMVPQSERILGACQDPANTTPDAVFYALWDKDYDKKSGDAVTKTNTKALARLSNLPSNITHDKKSRKKYAVAHALKRLQEELQGNDIVASARKKLLQGDMSGLNTCPLSCRAEVIYDFNFLEFKRKPREIQVAFLQALIAVPFTITTMKLMNFNGQDRDGMDKGLRLMFVKALKGIIARSPNLVRLTLDNCSGVDKELVRFVATNCKKLQYLDLTGCHELDDFSLKGVDKPLQFLELTYLRLTKTNVSSVSVYAPKLLRLYINECQYLYRVYLKSIDLSDRNLRVLDIEGSAVKRMDREFFDKFISDINEIIASSYQLTVLKQHHQGVNLRAFAWYAMRNNRLNRAALRSLIRYTQSDEEGELQATLFLLSLDITDKDMRILARCLEQDRHIPEEREPLRVEVLDASYCKKLTPSGILDFAAGALPFLKKIIFNSEWSAISSDRVGLPISSSDKVFSIEDLGVRPDGQLIYISENGSCTLADASVLKRAYLGADGYSTDLLPDYYHDTNDDHKSTHLLMTLPDGRELISWYVSNVNTREKITSLLLYDPFNKSLETIFTLPFDTWIHIEIAMNHLFVVQFTDPRVSKKKIVKLYELIGSTVSLYKEREFANDEPMDISVLDDEKFTSNSMMSMSTCKSSLAASEEASMCHPQTKLHAQLKGQHIFATIPGSILVKESQSEQRSTTMEKSASANLVVLTIEAPLELDFNFTVDFPTRVTLKQSPTDENSIDLNCSHFINSSEKGAWVKFENFLRKLAPYSTVESNGNVITLTNCPVDIKVLNRFVCALTGKKNAYQYTSIPGRSPVPKDIPAAEPTEVPQQGLDLMQGVRADQGAEIPPVSLPN